MLEDPALTDDERIEIVSYLKPSDYFFTTYKKGKRNQIPVLDKLASSIVGPAVEEETKRWEHPHVAHLEFSQEQYIERIYQR